MASLPTPGEIKKLAAACRKAGISHFKCGDVEFTLAPKEQAAAPASAKQSIQEDTIESDGWDSLTEEQKMLFSVGGLPINIGDAS